MIIIEGNIGAGKSTFLKLLAKASQDLEVAQEPLESWHKKEDGSNLLENFYTDPKRWAYTLETFAMAARLQDHILNSKILKPIVVERSIYSGHYCFAKNDFLSGYMTAIEWELYQQWFKTIIASYAKPPKAFIYLKVSPKIALERIKKRSRIGEENISLEYLIEIEKRHEEFLINKQDILSNIANLPVKVLNLDQDINQDIINEALSFIKLNS